MIPQTMRHWKEQAEGVTIIAIDIEAGGLNNATHKDHTRIPEPMIGAQFYPILEITAKFFNGNFQEVADPMTFVIHHSLESLHDKSSQWSKVAFRDTLFHECADSTISLNQADELISERVKELGSEVNYILGNSVDLDRSYIFHQMKNLSNTLHYRMFDVSTLKLLFGFLYGDTAKFVKTEVHRTEGDITETMKELKFYLDNFIKGREIVAREQILS